MKSPLLCNGSPDQAVALWPAGVLGFMVGTALQLQQPQLWSQDVYICFIVFVLVGWWLAAIKSGSMVWLAGARQTLVLVLGVALGLGGTGLRALVRAHDTLEPALEGRSLVVSGRVVAMPQRNEAGLHLRLAVEQARTLQGQAVRVPGVLWLGWYGGVVSAVSEPDVTASETRPARWMLQAPPPDVRAGELWEFTVRLKQPHGGRNPHGFDYELWLWEQGLRATGTVRLGSGEVPPQRLAPAGWRVPLERARQSVRDAIVQRLTPDDTDDAATLSRARRAAGVVAALVVGDQAAIDRADWDVFRATGVAHLMSISGLHITMFAAGATALLGALWRRSPRLCLAWPAPLAARWGGVGLALAYALFSGWGVPAQRTVWMLIVASVLRQGALHWPWPLQWLLVAGAVVLVDPWALAQPGFWLSFVAVGVLIATDSVATNDHRTGTWTRFIPKLGGFVREQWVVTLALAPLSLLLFGQVSVVGLVANAVAIPWVTAVITPLAMLGVLAPPCWSVAAGAVQWLGDVLHWLAAWSWATLSLPAAPLWAGACALAGATLGVMRLPWALRLSGVGLALPLLLWQLPRPEPGEFELLAVDVGQGNAVLLRTATHALLYDAGPRYSREVDAGHRVLVPLLRTLGERIDRLVLSHRDSDHTGGAAAVLAASPGAQLLSSLEPTHALLQGRHETAQRCEAGQQWDWDGVRFEVLHPQVPDYVAPRLKPNALSCVLRVSNPRTAALLVGDIEAAQEAQLLQHVPAPSLRADVLLVPHHGSKTSSTAGFLAAVRPQLALVQAGYLNRFGHPAQPVLARYEAQGVQVVGNVNCGAATWRSNEPAAVQCERMRHRRYWQHEPAREP